MSPRGQGKGGRTLWPQGEPGQLECEENGAGAPSPQSEPVSKAVEKLLASWREGSVRQKQAAGARTLCITQCRSGWPGHRRLLWEEQQLCGRQDFQRELLPPSHSYTSKVAP